MNEKNRYDLSSKLKIAILIHLEGWQNKVAKDLENMLAGQKCYIISSMYEREDVKDYQNKLSDALGDKREDYEFSIEKEDLLYKLEVRRK